MGSVYAADPIDGSARVAIKLITPDDDEDETALARFQREAKLASSVDSPHVTRVFDTGIDETTGRPFMVMELLEGEELDDVLDRVGALPATTVLRIAAQALSGLQKAHDAGVIHRDVKPQNLFLSKGEDEDELVVKILDFGIAKFRPVGELSHESKALTQTGAMMGSPLYMSPEQAKGDKSLDRRTDLWSMGIVMYRCLTGKVPHEDVDTLGQLIIDICGGPPEPVQTLAPWVSPQLADVVEQALEVEADKRFQTAEEMHEAITAQIGTARKLLKSNIASVSKTERKMVAPPSRASVPLQAHAISHADTIADLQPPQDPRKSDTHNGISNVTDPGRPMRQRFEVYIGGAVLLLIGFVASAVWMGGDNDPKPVTSATPVGSTAGPTVAPATSSAPPAPSESAPAESANVRVTINATPTKVDVYLDGKKVGRTGEAFDLPRGDIALELTLKKPGYIDRKMPVTPQKDQELAAALRRKPTRKKKGPNTVHSDLESPQL